METVPNQTYDIIDYNLIKNGEIDLNWIPFTDWIRFRFDNDGIIITTNLRTGYILFMNTTSGLILSLCSGKNTIKDIVQCMVSRFPDQPESRIFQDVKHVLYENSKIGNIIVMKKKWVW